MPWVLSGSLHIIPMARLMNSTHLVLPLILVLSKAAELIESHNCATSRVSGVGNFGGRAKTVASSFLRQQLDNGREADSAEPSTT